MSSEQQSFEIFVWMHRSGRDPMSLMAEASDTIESVKAKVQEQEGIPLDQCTLFRNYTCDMALEESKTISYYGIDECDVLCCKKMLRIAVSGVGGETITLNVGASDTIDKVKALIQEKKGIPPDQQRLIFGLDVLQGEKQVSDYNIQKDDKLSIVLV